MSAFFFDDETTLRLEQLALRAGVSSVEQYVRSLVAASSSAESGRSIDEFDADLAPLLMKGPSLPDIFSRVDIYDERA